jgi:hypothetical protein
MLLSWATTKTICGNICGVEYSNLYKALYILGGGPDSGSSPKLGVYYVPSSDLYTFTSLTFLKIIHRPKVEA